MSYTPKEQAKAMHLMQKTAEQIHFESTKSALLSLGENYSYQERWAAMKFLNDELATDIADWIDAGGLRTHG